MGIKMDKLLSVWKPDCDGVYIHFQRTTLHQSKENNNILAVKERFNIKCQTFLGTELKTYIIKPVNKG